MKTHKTFTLTQAFLIGLSAAGCFVLVEVVLFFAVG